MGRAISHASSLVNYLFKEEKAAKILDSEGIDLSSPKAIVGDLEMIKNNRLKNQYLSMVISPAELGTTDEMLKKLMKDTLAELGLLENQYVAVIHDNTEHKHLHILVNRTDYNGKTFNDSYIGLRAKEYSKELAMKYNLESAYDKQNAKKNKTSLKNSEYHKQLGGSIEYAKKILNEVLNNPTTQHVDQIYDHLRSKGIDVNITQHKNKTYGVSLEHDGHKMKASDVSRLLSLKLLENGGYTANNKLQPILDRNTIHANTKRTERDILKDIASDPGNQSAYLQEMRALKATMVSNLNKKDDDEMENDQKLKKKSKKGKQLGMRVKY
jgi:hypothetical protein